jgi:hypothetical protein
VGRAAALLALAALAGAYYAAVSHLPSAGLWWKIAWLGLVVIPAVCALVLLALPLYRLPVAQLALAAGCFLAFTLLCSLADLDVLANFGKLATVTFGAWAFLWFFEELSWVVLIACLIPWVDAYSVWRGPTKKIVDDHTSVFEAFSFAFPAPGGVTNLGLTDLFFFALFLAAADRFGLRVLVTFFALSLSFGATMALAVWLDVSGLPALPLLALAFLLANADLLWRRLRRRTRAQVTTAG